MNFNYNNPKGAYFTILPNGMAHDPYTISFADCTIDTAQWCLIEGKDSPFYKGLQSCFVQVQATPTMIELYRYPTPSYCGDFSRDQWVIVLACLTLMGEIEYRDWLIEHTGRRLSLKFKKLPGIRLWEKAILRRSKTFAWLFCIYSSLVPFAVLWMRFMMFIGRIKLMSIPEYDEFQKNPQPLTKFQKKFAKNKMLPFPVYALNKFIWQLYTLPDVAPKRWLQWILRNIGDPNNYVHRMMLGGEVTKEQVESMGEYSEDRNSAWLIKTNWGVKPIPDYACNSKNKALVMKIFEIKNS